MNVERLIHGAAQLLTLAGPHPRHGADMSDLALIEDGAVAIHDGRIVAVGPTADLRAEFTADEVIDATGKVVMPGFVDPHTHAVWAGDRADEFEMRLRGATYMEIMAAGGGIMSTVRATRAAGVDELIAQSRRRLDAMLAHGTTTAEVKTGYGLELETELKTLAAIAFLDAHHPLDLVPTFLGAHAVPTEYAGRSDEYVGQVIQEMLPQFAQPGQCVFHAERVEGREAVKLRPRVAFCDVFCDEGAFSLEQARRVLEAAKAWGNLGLKIHADEFKPLGGTRLAVELGAISADHLVCTPLEEIELLAQSDTVAVALPGTPFGLGHHDYTPARAIISAGGALALATDLNPGTCWCESMPFVIALACRYMKLTPAEAIVAATINAACAVGLAQKIGSLEAGKQADLVILNLPTYRHLAYRFGSNPVQTVIKAGQRVVG
ncbi:MAG: imidazolonepropionase [Chloroflexota bacterium]|nr:imidazolonepropionase [Chloroflexota bacterium]